MIRRIAVPFLFVASLFVLVAPARAKMDSTKFLTRAAQGGKAELQVSQLALEKAESPDVKQFAQKMMNDHTQMNQEVSDLASQKNISLPADLSRSQQKEHRILLELSGRKFDKEFMKYNLKDHSKDLQVFKEQAEDGSDPDIMDFAAKEVPTLKSHLELAKSVAKQVNED